MRKKIWCIYPHTIFCAHHSSVLICISMLFFFLKDYLSYIILLVMVSFSFCMCEDVFIFFLFLKDTSKGYKILGWYIFFSTYPLPIRFQGLTKQSLNSVSGENARGRQGRWTQAEPNKTEWGFRVQETPAQESLNLLVPRIIKDPFTWGWLGF